MNYQVASLFKGLESESIEKAAESALALAFLLERTIWPGRYDSTHRLALPAELIRLKLSSHLELEEVINGLGIALTSTRIPVDARVTLASAIGKTRRSASIKCVLALLEMECETLSDEYAYGLLAVMLPGIGATKPRALLASALSEHHTISVLNRLSCRKSDRLTDILAMFRSSLQKLHLHP